MLPCAGPATVINSLNTSHRRPGARIKPPLPPTPLRGTGPPVDRHLGIPVVDLEEAVVKLVDLASASALFALAYTANEQLSRLVTSAGEHERR